jgi:N-acetylglucosaminyldiphosphoundecaprenol N-acetyl-beta-D-mannosaminyltransferase
MRHHVKRPLFGCRISTLSMDDLLAEIARAPATDGVRLLVTLNLDHLVHLRRNEQFRAAYSRSWTATIDSAPLIAYAHARRSGVPARITGADLAPALLRALPLTRRPFFVTSTTAVGDSLLKLCQARGFPRESVSYASPPFGFESSPHDSAELLSAIRRHGTTDLVFGVGSPKTEIWIDGHRDRLGNLYAYGFGQGLDFMAGAVRRAPLPMRRLGLEWIWRLVQEPGRRWRRSLIDAWLLFPSIAEDLAGRAPHGKASLTEPTSTQSG